VTISWGFSPSADRARRDVVQRWVQALASRQYHLVSSHQSPPSGIILLECSRIPHSQHETTPARRAPLPFPGGRRGSSAMTSPPVDQPRPASRLPDKHKTNPARRRLDNR
jgi:hypothetical protein